MTFSSQVGRECHIGQRMSYRAFVASALNHLRIVFEILSEHKFFVKPSKCACGAQEVDYLGHIISQEGVRIDNLKIEAMQSWPKPKIVTELRGFLGLMGYYRKFVRNYGPIA
jgi:hypothetical protein